MIEPLAFLAVGVVVGLAALAAVRGLRWRALVVVVAVVAVTVELVRWAAPAWTGSALRACALVAGAALGSLAVVLWQRARPRPADGRRLRVLLDVPESNWRKNPYISELVRNLGPDVEVLGFDRRRALLGSYDLVHAHWPEHRVAGPAGQGTLRRRAWWVLWMLRLHAQGTPVVRTRHNRSPHDPVPQLDRVLLRALEARCRGQVWLSTASQSEAGATPGPTDVVIPHGTYNSWIGRSRIDRRRPRPLQRPYALVSVGFLRRYKNFEEGMEAVAGAEEFALTIAGQASDDEYAAELSAQAADNVTVHPHRLHNLDLMDLVLRSDAVLLPYADLYNSGVVFLALGLGRPVILRDNLMARELRDEWGAEWIGLYDGTLTCENLHTAWAAVAGATDRPTGSPRRAWKRIGREHAALYRRVAGRR